ncbi:peptidylprolyl isomerase [Nitrospinae bacterium AH_259_B05_G02_I21]|nr:peptidylprolyl isomerase [Nitrospinae bacterium AH_259_B05_G02_I21]MDA2932195.1 peptidylprolyl isomerase [Nitrospinae bacterium AH-259-F20]
MSTVEEGRMVMFHYTGTLADGSVFDSSRGRSPMEVRIGAGQIVPGFEAGIMGMRVGETRTFAIAPKDAYGEHDENLCHRVEKERFPDPKSVEVGMTFRYPLGDGRTAHTIIQVGDEDVLLDLNHPLAGEELTFEVECLEIRNS